MYVVQKTREKLHYRKKNKNAHAFLVPHILRYTYLRPLLDWFGVYSSRVFFDFVIYRFNNNTRHESERANRIENLNASIRSCNSSHVVYIRNLRHVDDMAGSGNLISCRQRALQPRKVYTSAGT